MRIDYHTEPFQAQLLAGLSTLKENDVVERIWDRDHTLWKPYPEEITNRLGWLDIPKRIQGSLPRIKALVDDLQKEGLTDILLLGMGGSSLAPELFSLIFSDKPSPFSLGILDSTDPEAVCNHRDRLDPHRTLFIVATKSGSTVETLSFFKYFYQWTVEAVGASQAGTHFIGITDPGSSLIEWGERLGFRDLFLNDPNIGGRYSALSFFGLVPATLIGVDLQKLLSRAQEMMELCRPSPALENHPGAVLGNTLGILAENGRDKVTFNTSPSIASYPNWIEQLLAESTGKEGKGILPVVGEPLGTPEVYREDRVFVHLSTGDKAAPPGAFESLHHAGHPVIHIQMDDLYDLGAQFFSWEFATAVAGFHLGINPFDQPNVESAKIRAKEMVERYEKDGSLPEGETSPLSWDRLSTFIENHLQEGSYIAIQAFIPPSDTNRSFLNQLRVKLRDEFKLATTLGFGPRFLHSTGQLHKGDAGKGIFLQFTSQTEQDIPIPKKPGGHASSIDFGTLKRAQALGDAQALRGAGRSLVRFSLGKDPEKELEHFLNV
jgi:glucose-6-phosphate isomerase